MPKLGSQKSCLVFFLAVLPVIAAGEGCTSRKIIPQPGYDSTTIDRAPRININVADERELEKLPHVGPALAAKIVAYRKRYGPLRKVEHLLLIDGFSDKRFREIENFITTE